MRRFFSVLIIQIFIQIWLSVVGAPVLAKDGKKLSQIQITQAEEKVKAKLRPIKPSISEIWATSNGAVRINMVIDRITTIAKSGLLSANCPKNREDWRKIVEEANSMQFHGQPLNKYGFKGVLGVLKALGAKADNEALEQLESLDNQAGIYLTNKTLVKNSMLKSDVINTVSLIDGSFTSVQESMMIYYDRFRKDFANSINKIAEDKEDGIEEVVKLNE